MKKKKKRPLILFFWILSLWLGVGAMAHLTLEGSTNPFYFNLVIFVLSFFFFYYSTFYLFLSKKELKQLSR